MHRYRLWLLAGSAWFLLLVVLANASWVYASAIVLTFNPNAREGGMGETGNAVFWGDVPNYWANPALLGYQRGLGFQSDRSTVAPGLADNIEYRTDRLTVAAYGIGMFFGGLPFSLLKGYELDMGEQEGRDEQGNPTGLFESWQRVRAWGIGVSAAELIYGFFRDPDEEGPGPFRYGDVALGFVYKKYEDQMAPDAVLQDRTLNTKAYTYDYGLLLRLSPYNSVDYPRGDWGLDRTLDVVCGGLRFDFGFGLSVLNARETWLESDDQRDPLPKEHRHGWSIYLATGVTGALRDGLRAERWGWLADALTPLLAWGITEDRALPGIRWDDAGSDYVYEKADKGEERKYSGWELSLANLFHLRRGHLSRPPADVDGDTSGWGLGFHFGRYGSIRYDEATIPQPRGLPDVERRSWSLVIDVQAIWEGR
jgi:hypothetical protein